MESRKGVREGALFAFATLSQRERADSGQSPEPG